MIPGPSDALVIKTNTLGTVEWAKTYGGVKSDVIYDALLLSDSTVVFTGYSNSFPSTIGTKSYAFNIDLSGNLIWSMVYGQPYASAPGYAATEGKNGEKYIVGGGSKARLYKTNANGLTGCNETVANQSVAAHNITTSYQVPLINTPNSISVVPVVYTVTTAPTVVTTTCGGCQ